MPSAYTPDDPRWEIPLTDTDRRNFGLFTDAAIARIDQIYAIAAEHTERPLTTFRSHLQLGADLGIDSLDRVALTLALEKTFTIAIPDADMLAVQTLADLVLLVDRLHVDPQLPAPQITERLT